MLVTKKKQQLKKNNAVKEINGVKNKTGPACKGLLHDAFKDNKGNNPTADEPSRMCNQVSSVYRYSRIYIHARDLDPLSHLGAMLGSFVANDYDEMHVLCTFYF